MSKPEVIETDHDTTIRTTTESGFGVLATLTESGYTFEVWDGADQIVREQHSYDELVDWLLATSDE